MSKLNRILLASQQPVDDMADGPIHFQQGTTEFLRSFGIEANAAKDG